MPSSIKMIKAHKVYGGGSSVRIDTQIEVEEDNRLEDEIENPADVEIRVAQKKSWKLLKEAQQEAGNILEEAKAASEQIQKEAYEEANASGRQEGYQAGFNQGLTEGLKQAALQNEEAKASIMEMFKVAQTEVAAYQKDKRDDIIQLASHMAEKIVHDYIDTADESLLKLAMPYIYQLDKDEEFVSITTHPKQQAILSEHIHKIEAISPQTRFVVLADPSLEKNGLVIESSKAVIDLQIKKQIDAMLQEFEEMERTVND